MCLIFSLPNKVIVNTITSISNIKCFRNPSLKTWESLFKFFRNEQVFENTIQLLFSCYFHLYLLYSTIPQGFAK